jgi:hypothetical protein
MDRQLLPRAKLDRSEVALGEHTEVIVELGEAFHPQEAIVILISAMVLKTSGIPICRPVVITNTRTNGTIDIATGRSTGRSNMNKIFQGMNHTMNLASMTAAINRVTAITGTTCTAAAEQTTTNTEAGITIMEMKTTDPATITSGNNGVVIA